MPVPMATPPCYCAALRVAAVGRPIGVGDSQGRQCLGGTAREPGASVHYPGSGQRQHSHVHRRNRVRMAAGVVPDPGLVYNYLSWTRTYDNWSFYAIGYWNPESFNLITSASPGKNLFNGKGFELMVNYNF